MKPLIALPNPPDPARIGIVALLLSLAGCAVGPDFARPRPPVADRYTAAASAGGQPLLPGRDIAGDWWTLFRAPALTQLVAQALADNPNLASSRQALIEAQETTIAQQGGFLPSISAQFLHQREEYSGATGGQPGYSENFSYNSALLNVSYSFDVWGANRRAVEADAAAAEYQRFLLEAATNMLAANTANAAISAAALADQIAAEQALLANERHLLASVQSQFELGAATGADVAAQATQVAQTQALLPPLATQLAQTQDQLADYLGQIPSQARLPRLRLDDLTLPASLPLSLPSDLVAQRPDIRAAEAELHQASARLGIAIANRLPQFTLSAAIGSAAARPYQLFSPGNGAWSVLDQALAPIFQGGALLHQQRAASAALAAQAASYKATVVAGFHNVADCLVALSGDADALRAERDAETAAARSLAVARSQYDAGQASYQTVLTAEIQDQTATINVIKAREARFTDTVALFTALGGGWWHRQDAARSPAGLLKSLVAVQ